MECQSISMPGVGINEVTIYLFHDSLIKIIFMGADELAELIILGSGTGIPSLRRGSPGLLIMSDSTRTY